MSSQAHLSVVAPAYVPPRRKPHNTNRGRKFPPEPITTEEFEKLLNACYPLMPGRFGELSALRLRTLIVHARLDVTARYLAGIDPAERLAPLAARKPPMTRVPSIHAGPVRH